MHYTGISPVSRSGRRRGSCPSMPTNVKYWGFLTRGRTSSEHPPIPFMGRHSGLLMRLSTLASPSTKILAGNPTSIPCAKKATAHSAFSDAIWGDALLTSRNRHIRHMFAPSWNTLLQYGTPTPRTSSPSLKWSSDVQPDLWRPIVVTRVVSPRCYKAFSGRLYRNDAHTARSSCCTGSTMDLSPSPLAPLPCTPH